jgi:hypothetical protein
MQISNALAAHLNAHNQTKQEQEVDTFRNSSLSEIPKFWWKSTAIGSVVISPARKKQIKGRDHSMRFRCFGSWSDGRVGRPDIENTVRILQEKKKANTIKFLSWSKIFNTVTTDGTLGLYP